MQIDINNFVEKLIRKEIKMHELDRIIFSEFGNDPNKWGESCAIATSIRLNFIEKTKNKKFPDIEKCFVDISGKNTTGVENLIGGAVTPLGIAGPLNINGQYAKGEFYIPLATNEAALIAGLSRGCKAINESGVKTIVTRSSMTRAPVLEFPDVASAKKLVDAINTDFKFFDELKKAAEQESKVSKLICIQPFQVGKRVWLRFVFETGDSMGMNSVTKYTANAIKKLKELYPKAKLIALSGNMCCDKKASHINILLGRGKSVEAEITIKKEVLKKIYNTTAKTIEKINFVKNYQGSALAGTLTGFNANAANTIAAMFIATGQDAAQIVESSSCFVTAEDIDGNLYFSVSLPCLEIGAVGGGMGRATARECLEILDCAGPGKNTGENAKKLAEIIAAAVLAQELNLLATLANEFELGESHIRLARGK